MSEIKFSSAEELGIKLFEAGGFSVETTEKTFRILKDEVCVRGYSNRHWLSSMSFVCNQMREIAFEKGMNAGKLRLQKDIKLSLGL